MLLKDYKYIYSKAFYDRKDGETTFAYIIRIIIAETICFVTIMFPIFIILADNEGQPILEYVLHYGLPAYIGVIIGGPIGLLKREERIKRKHKGENIKKR